MLFKFLWAFFANVFASHVLAPDAPRRVGSRWVFPDGTTLPVVAGGDHTVTKTRRERLEEANRELTEMVAEYEQKSELTADERDLLDKKQADVTRLVEEIKSHATAGSAIDMAKGLLDDLGGAGGDSPEPAAGDNGLVDAKGMTLGEAFAKSPAFTEFLEQFKGADGKIRAVQGIKSGVFDVPGGELGPDSAMVRRAKALVTGASDTSGGAFVVAQRYPVVTDLIGDRELTIRDLCTNIPITSDTFEYVRVTGKTNNAAAVAEATTSDDPANYGDPASGAKPESALTLAVVNSPVETLAHLLPITRRAAADAPQVRALVDQFGIQGLREEEEDQILNGDGNSPNLEGILQTAGISTVGSAGTDLDAVVDAIRTIRNDRRRPTAMAIHPNDWYSTGFLLAKDSQGRYILGDPRASVDQLNTLWGLRVVVTEAMTENTALVGDFRQAVVADRQQATIYVSDSHKDWFGRNILAVLFEERLGFGVLDPDAFCTVTAI